MVYGFVVGFIVGFIEPIVNYERPHKNTSKKIVMQIGLLSQILYT
jgi:hypothetical protein